MSIRDFFRGQKYDDDLRYPSRATEVFRPRKAAQMWSALEEAENQRIDALAHEHIARERRDAAYGDWAGNEYHKGNPPDSELRDREIERASELFPETDRPEYGQEDHEGLTLPRWPGDWTFTQWAGERGYCTERIEEVNDMYPQDPREQEAARHLEERQAARRHGQMMFVPDPRLGEPKEREIRGEPDPCNPLCFPDYSYWPQTQTEAGQ